MTPVSGVTYSRGLIMLHWLIAALVLALLACVELHEVFPKGSFARSLFMQGHFWLGISIGLLTLLRLYLRMGQHPAPIVPPPALWQTRLADLVQWAFYGILLIMPVLGYLMINAKGFDLSIGSFSFGHYLAENKALAQQLEEIHETIGNVFIALLVLHTGAALYHHYVLKDSTFSRVQPPL